ncbi:MAG TPA: hypothetical protein VGZ49_15250 [Xanthobacteraceae bacterium]|nr:hypothetical protein [Xanthobacteraceae bacterium]
MRYNHWGNASIFGAAIQWMLKRFKSAMAIAPMLCTIIGFLSQDVSSQQSAQPKDAETYQHRKDEINLYSPLKGFWNWTTHDAVSFYTFMLAIFTAVLGATAIVQIRYLRRADETAKIAADAVRDQASLTREAMIRTQRAFVFVKRVCVGHQINLVQSTTGPLVEVVVGWNIGVQWENTGDTPTRDLLTHISIHEFEGEMPTDYEFPDLNETTTKSLLGPKAVCFSPVFAIPDSQARRVFLNGNHLYMWGWAEYDDVFPGTERHRTEFCYELLFIAPFPSKSSFTHKLHTRYNGAEDECLKPLQTSSRTK